jgi:hypothetical protein
MKGDIPTAGSLAGAVSAEERVVELVIGVELSVYTSDFNSLQLPLGALGPTEPLSSRDSGHQNKNPGTVARVDWDPAKMCEPVPGSTFMNLISRKSAGSH